MDKSLYSFVDGVIINKDTFIFVGVEDARAEKGLKHGLIWKYKTGIWNHVEIAEPLVSCTLTNVPEYRFIAIAETGRELIIGDKVLRQEVVASGSHSPVAFGPLTTVKCWEHDQIYAVGTARQVYRKISVDQWERDDQSCISNVNEERAFSAFLDIDGYSKTEVYAVGLDGEIWLHDGTIWKRKDSPTNLILHSVCCAENGAVYICGQNGVVIKGRRDEWKLVDQDTTSEDFRGICYYSGDVYVCSSNLIYSLLGNELLPITLETPFLTTGKLKSSSGLLMSVGLKDIVLFDGKSWDNLI